MSQASICLTQFADNLENHGNMLALLTELPATELSERGRVGLIQFSAWLMQDFQKIEKEFKNYRASLTPSC